MIAHTTKALLALLTVFMLAACGNSNQQGGPPPGDFPVQVASPIMQTVTPTEVYTGRFEAVEEVNLQARVSGYLESVHFDEGNAVKAGDLMFQIDPAQLDAALLAAKAGVKQVEARRDLANVALERAERLAETQAIAAEEVDIRTSELAQARADLLAAEARLQQAQLDRMYADVKAPISGIAGQFLVTPGNYITGGMANATPLASIVPHDPIYCSFEVDERQVLKFTRMYFEGEVGGREGEATPVEISVSDSEDFNFKGYIDFAENQLDESTATLRMRAEVANENKFLTPGLFAKVRVSIGQPFEAILVQDSALGFDQSKRFAWVVQEDNTVERRFVEVGDLEGELRIIESGVTPEERIVVSGIQLLRPGMKVAPTERAMVPGEEEPEAPPEEDAITEPTETE